MARAWHGRGMEIVNQTRPHCVNQMGKTHSKPLVARHALFESALIVAPTCFGLHNHHQGAIACTLPKLQY